MHGLTPAWPLSFSASFLRVLEFVCYVDAFRVAFGALVLRGSTIRAFPGWRVTGFQHLERLFDVFALSAAIGA